MNLIYDAYPDSVMLNGAERGIVTDFKDWLRFVDMLKDMNLRDEEKLQVMLDFYLEDIPVCDLSSVHRPLIDFFGMRDADERMESKKTEQSVRQVPKALYDYQIDARYIIAGFWQDYGIDLTESKMHWWKFRILLDGLSEKTEFKQRVMYRNTDTGKIGDVNERNRILRIQQSIAIPQAKPDEFEIGGMFW
ncbi:MAG: Gp15 family bacteriophage protein [Hungatella sp.]